MENTGVPVPAWNPERLGAKAKGEGLRRNGFFRMMGGTAIRHAAVSALRILKCRTRKAQPRYLLIVRMFAAQAGPYGRERHSL